jgi:hypothetical protein
MPVAPPDTSLSRQAGRIGVFPPSAAVVPPPINFTGMAPLVGGMGVGKDQVQPAVMRRVGWGPVRHFPQQHGAGWTGDIAGRPAANRPVDFVSRIVFPEVNVIPDVCHIVVVANQVPETRDGPVLAANPGGANIGAGSGRGGGDSVGGDLVGEGVLADERFEKRGKLLVPEPMVIAPRLAPTLAKRESFTEIGRVHGDTQTDLPQVVQAISLLGFGFRFGQRGEQHSRKNGDDGDDHQEFNEGERLAIG